MSKSIKLAAMFGMVAAIAACTSGQTEEEFVVVEPVTTEPVFTGKFK